MNTIMVELPRWLYYCMAINTCVSVALLLFKMVEIVERH